MVNLYLLLLYNYVQDLAMFEFFVHFMLPFSS